MGSIATASVTGNNNTATDWVDARGSRLVDVSVYGGTTSTVTLQRSFDGGTTPLDVDSYSADTEVTARNAGACKMRLICKTGDYVDGATLRISVGNKE